LREHDAHKRIERVPALLDFGAQDRALIGIQKENRQAMCMGVR
jgi:hypothetical protein